MFKQVKSLQKFLAEQVSWPWWPVESNQIKDITYELSILHNVGDSGCIQNI